MWASSHLHASRRSHDESRNELNSSRSSSPDDGTETRHRTSSDATPRPTPSTTRFLNMSNEQDTNRNVIPSNAFIERSEGFGTSKRLGFFADRLTSSLSGSAKDSNATSRNALHPGQLLHSHSHARVDSSQLNLPALSPTGLAVSSTLPGSAKSHTSPSKSSYGRTYDSKTVQREIHRLGSLAHLPTTLAPQLSSAPSISSISLPSQGNISQVNGLNASIDPWSVLHLRVLPLFSGEALRVPIEDLNVLVKRHIRAVITSAPSKALATLENDTSELIAQGMVTINAKLNGVEDEKLVARVVEVWGFFWDNVLTYLEGVLLPLQTESLLFSLYRTPKAKRPASPTSQNLSISTSSNSTSTNHIDVRSIALQSFRDSVILPLFERLYARLSVLSRRDGFRDADSYQQPRLQQMLLVLSAQSCYVPATLSLTTPSPEPTAGEAAIKDLLRLIRNPRPDIRHSKLKGTFSKTSTFLSGALPRDRRGKVPHKGRDLPSFVRARLDDDALGEETPRIGPPNFMLEIVREREFLEALRSPDMEPSVERHDSGGWGLGAGNEDNSKLDEEDEPSDWEQIHEQRSR